MNSKKKGLGKGLSALFGEQKKPENTSKIKQNVQKALVGELARNKYQPRTIFDQSKLDELAQSIRKNGMIQPIAVRKNNSLSEPYEIVAGERRWLAAQKAGLHEVPITILELNDSETLEIAIVENIQREDLNIIEEAKGYKRLTEEFGHDQDKISKFMSKSRSHVSNTLRLLNLPKDIIAMIEQGELTAGQARPLIGMPNASEIAENVVKKKLAAREIETFIKQKKLPANLPSIPKSIPAAIVERRPDIRSLILKVESNVSRVSQSKRNLLPGVSLTGSLGTSTQNFEKLLDNDYGIWNLGLNVTAPIFNGKRLRSAIKVQEAAFEISRQDLIKGLLKAFSEVEQLMHFDQSLKVQINAMRSGVEQSKDAYNLSKERYDKGVTTLESVLSSQRQYNTIKSQYLQLQRQSIENRLLLILALGGDFGYINEGS